MKGWILNKIKETYFEMPTFVAEEFFTKGNDWSAACQRFFINEHNDRTGLKGIVLIGSPDLIV